jgi:hypothetical protein
VPVFTVTIVATGIADVSNTCCYCAFTGLVSPRSSKLELSYLKTETCIAVSNFITRTRVCVRERQRGFGEIVHASRQRPREWLHRQCAHVGHGAPSYGDRS